VGGGPRAPPPAAGGGVWPGGAGALPPPAPVGHLLAGAAAQAWPVRDVLVGMATGAALVAAGVGVLAVRRPATGGRR
jgi:hypothetical protein